MAEVLLHVDFIETARGGRHLVWNGYTYRQNNKIETWISWKCTQRNFKATICTREDWTTTQSSTRSSRSGGKAHTQHHTKKSRNELTPLPSIYDEEITKPRNAPWDAQSREVAKVTNITHSEVLTIQIKTEDATISSNYKT